MDGFEAAGASWSKSDIRVESSPWEGRQISLLQPLAATVLLSLGFSAHLGDSWTVSQASHLSSLAEGEEMHPFPHFLLFAFLLLSGTFSSERIL